MNNANTNSTASSYTLDHSIAPRRYVLIDEATGILGTDWELTPAEAANCNRLLRNEGSPWRWFVWAEASEAA